MCVYISCNCSASLLFFYLFPSFADVISCPINANPITPITFIAMHSFVIGLIIISEIGRHWTYIITGFDGFRLVEIIRFICSIAVYLILNHVSYVLFFFYVTMIVTGFTLLKWFLAMVVIPS